ncbi:hypothetical protein [Nostoc sp. UHCC 0251]|uniref:hypothetical protein n=1 Tax=Nostoc sp. UHCC 0251 TaxID=3110240 RepID=UPI002B2017B3|nr:hypothetical protein [Nostoc sp. UHCC 0251]MEA5621952.1 hypothetical protein [Nostoc sp. UHCC 0251]
MTINFGEQRLSIDGVTIQFGLKRGKLKLRLQNGNIPIESIDTSQFINFQVDLIAVSENNISWVFQINGQISNVLTGLHNKIKLGTVSKDIQQLNTQDVNMDNNGRCSVEATFELVSIRDICITEIEYEQPNLLQEVVTGFFNTNKKKKAVLERAFFNEDLRKQLFEPCILQAEFYV